MTAPASLEDALGVSFADRDLLELALTHRSYAFEAGGLPTNERLEFLGDAVLGLAVTERIYVALPEAPEGQLAKIRASAVNTRSLAGVARELRLGELVHLGRGEEQSGGRDKDSILADTLEAVLGAVYLDQGLETASELVGCLFGALLEDLARRRDALDHKTALQELTAAADAGLPVYHVSEEGPDHDKRFTAVVEVQGETLGQGVGRSKKDAEQGAAREAYGTLRQRWEATPTPPQDGGHR